jgi:uncharacterized protein YbbC (DUF1343 family)
VIGAGLALAGVVEVGLDVVAARHGDALAGKRVGLVANAASLTKDGRATLDVLRGSGVEVVRLFAPEHGLTAATAAGEPVADARDAGSGLPVVSLYGARLKPAPGELRDLDALVFDLQDAGVRFYSYSSTLLRCLEAAAESGVELVVLDRPNPLGGERMEGPLADPGAAGVTALAPGPLVHGLTPAELARFANARRERPARLRVVAMRGWRRSMSWGDTGRAWVPPSPNLRTAEAALVYPGSALLEATNVSEGRGSDAPFLTIGAPWLEPGSLAALRAQGLELTAARFTPRASQAAPDAKYRDVECRGLRIAVKDAAGFRPYAFGLTLLQALRRNRGFRWLREGAALDALLGTASVREALERGDASEAIVARDAAATEAFRRERAGALLY